MIVWSQPLTPGCRQNERMRFPNAYLYHSEFYIIFRITSLIYGAYWRHADHVVPACCECGQRWGEDFFYYYYKLEYFFKLYWWHRAYVNVLPILYILYYILYYIPLSHLYNTHIITILYCTNTHIVPYFLLLTSWYIKYKVQWM